MCHRIYGASKLDYDVLMPERTFNELQKGLEMAREAPLAVVSFEDSKSQLQAILKRYPRFFQVSKLNPGSKSKGRSSVKYITLNDTSAQLGVWYKEDPILRLRTIFARTELCAEANESEKGITFPSPIYVWLGQVVLVPINK